MNIEHDFYSSHKKECIPLICILNGFDIFPLEVTRHIISMYINIYWTSIKKLHNKYYTPDNDKLIKYHNQKSKNMTYYKTVTVDTRGDNRNWTFPKLESGFVYKNLRFSDGKNNDDFLHKCVIAHGNKIEQIMESQFQILRYIYGITNPNILPFSFCKQNEYLESDSSDVYISIIVKNQYGNIKHAYFSLDMDIYKINDFHHNPFYTNIQIREITPIDTKVQITNNGNLLVNYDLCDSIYDHYAVSHIILSFTENTIIDVNLLFNGINSGIKVNDLVYCDNKYIILLSNSDVHGIYFFSKQKTNITLSVTGKRNKDNRINAYLMYYNIVKK